jgi:two-component system response regulator MprA
MKVLIADDDPVWIRLLGDRLIAAGFTVDTVFDGHAAVTQIRSGDYDAVLLDVLMPRVDGHAVLRELRSLGSRAAVLMVTAKDEDEDKLKAFAAGADDYVVKPVRVPEIIARIRAIIRRTGNRGSKKAKLAVLRAGPLELDPLARTVRKNGRLIHVTKSEFAVLDLLMQSPGKVVPNSALVHEITEDEIPPHPGTIRVHIRNLRAKLGSHGGKSLIRTVHGLGYALRK